ncbi:ImmA/IrrE family metallo-endopeptidase [Paenibacillus sp. FSL M7-1046]|uniref:ImmA/IrrE family metallo-endopeptidase n=1 Tax=Paenibacillus sp. FSL M7-1046 TaxID=2975315 RepID=UPI0030F684E1
MAFLFTQKQNIRTHIGGRLINFSIYFKTPFEQLIEDEYRSKGVLTAADLDIQVIALLFHVEIVYYNGVSCSDNDMRVIFLNRYDDLFKQTMIFFHELCHVLRHAGDQRRMPQLFKQLQENEAEMFSLYSTMPFFMIEKINFSQFEAESIGMIAKEFQFPSQFAQLRLKQITERIAEAEFMSAFVYTATTMDENMYISSSTLNIQ